MARVSGRCFSISNKEVDISRAVKCFAGSLTREEDWCEL